MVGKEKVAPNKSNRPDTRRFPLVALICSALPPSYEFLRRRFSASAYYIHLIASTSPSSPEAFSSSSPPTMAIRDIVAEPSLLPVLKTSAETREQCEKLLSLLDPTAESTTSNPEEAILAASREQKQLFALLARLRGQNREAIFRVRETKQSTAEARQEIDRLHLQLQNLYYEQRHLTGEIAACESYE